MLLNKEVYKFIFPTKRAINYTPKVNYDSNNIIFKNLIIYGFQGSGKTSLVNSLVKIAIKKYGEHNVNAVMSEHGNLEMLMHFGLRPCLVNILFADNLTLRKLSRETLMDYFKIRHKFREKFGLNNGYILSILSLHRFHGIPVELRTTTHGLIVKDSTMNPYDRAILEKFIGKEFLSFLDNISSEREKDPSLKEYAVFVNPSIKGLIKIPICKEMYIKEIGNYIDLIRRGEI